MPLPKKAFCDTCGSEVLNITETAFEFAENKYEDVIQGVQYQVFEVTCDTCQPWHRDPPNPHSSSPRSQQQYHSGLGRE